MKDYLHCIFTTRCSSRKTETPYTHNFMRIATPEEIPESLDTLQGSSSLTGQYRMSWFGTGHDFFFKRAIGIAVTIRGSLAGR